MRDFRHFRFAALAAVAAATVAACSPSGPGVDRISTQSFVPQSTAGLPSTATLDSYRLGPGDKLRVIVFGEAELSGEFFVDGGGAVDLPLIGDVQAAGSTVREFEDRVVAAFQSGYLRDPKISIEVLNYRPFFIIGEVKNGGEYPYKAGLTVQDAVAMAGGYSYRANTGVVFIRRAAQDHEVRVNLEQRVPINPGDNIRVPERFF